MKLSNKKLPQRKTYKIQEKINNVKFVPTQNQSPAASGSSDLNSPEEYGTKGGKHKFPCGLCENKSFRERNQLYRHYSTSHFSENLKQYIDKKSCKICGLEMSQIQNLVSHIGAKHGMVEEFLAQDLHVPRVNQGKKNLFDGIKAELSKPVNSSQRSVKDVKVSGFGNIDIDLAVDTSSEIEDDEIEALLEDIEVDD